MDALPIEPVFGSLEAGTTLATSTSSGAADRVPPSLLLRYVHPRVLAPFTTQRSCVPSQVMHRRYHSEWCISSYRRCVCQESIPLPRRRSRVRLRPFFDVLSYLIKNLPSRILTMLRHPGSRVDAVNLAAADASLFDAQPRYVATAAQPRATVVFSLYGIVTYNGLANRAGNRCRQICLAPFEVGLSHALAVLRHLGGEPCFYVRSLYRGISISMGQEICEHFKICLAGMSRLRQCQPHQKTTLAYSDLF